MLDRAALIRSGGVRRALLFAAVTVLLCVFALSHVLGGNGAAAPATSRPSKVRVVSLAPSITKTLLALGARDELVGVSDYCLDTAVAGLPHVGSWLTPNYEGIARLDPTLILTLDDPGAPLERLRAVGPTRAVAWLGVAEMIVGVRAIGEATGFRDRARALASRIDAVLGQRGTRPGAPSVLLVIGGYDVRLSEIWFVRAASIHGAVLEAAGGRNAVAEPLHGPPRMSLTDAIALDPDAVVVLVPAPASEKLAERTRAEWAALDGLRAVQQHRVAVLAGADVQSVGPDVIDLVPRLRAELERLFGAP